jgi:hypothetical protein
LGGEIVELGEHGTEGQRHVVARIAVGDREDVQVVDLMPPRFEVRERSLDDEAETEEARIGHGVRGRPLGLRDLACFEAARADVNALRRTALNDPDLLDVDIETTLGRDHGVGATLAEGGALAAGVTDTSHWSARV